MSFVEHLQSPGEDIKATQWALCDLQNSCERETLVGPDKLLVEDGRCRSSLVRVLHQNQPLLHRRPTVATQVTAFISSYALCRSLFQIFLLLSVSVCQHISKGASSGVEALLNAKMPLLC